MRTSLVAVFVAILLNGCASVQTVGGPQRIEVGKTTVTVSGLEGFNRLAVKAPQVNNPNVFIVDNAIVLDQEPVRPTDNNGQVVIIWRLDADTASSYSFPDDAISIQTTLTNPPPEAGKPECGAFGPKKRAFVCVYTRPHTPRKWKYTLKVKNSSGADPEPLDPWVHQP
jgi:uncharacterized protein YceK